MYTPLHYFAVACSIFPQLPIFPFVSRFTTTVFHCQEPEEKGSRYCHSEEKDGCQFVTSVTSWGPALSAKEYAEGIGDQSQEDPEDGIEKNCPSYACRRGGPDAKKP